MTSRRTRSLLLVSAAVAAVAVFAPAASASITPAMSLSLGGTAAGSTNSVTIDLKRSTPTRAADQTADMRLEALRGTSARPWRPRSGSTP